MTSLTLVDFTSLTLVLPLFSVEFFVYVSRFTTKTVSNWGISGSGDVEGEAITGKRHCILLRIAHSTQSVLMGSYFGCFRDANSTFAFPHNIAISCKVSFTSLDSLPQIWGYVKVMLKGYWI